MAGERRSTEEGIHGGEMKGVAEVQADIETAMGDGRIPGLEETDSPHGSGALGRADERAKEQGYTGVEDKKARAALRKDLLQQGLTEEEADALVAEEYGAVTADNANPDRPQYEEGDDTTDESVEALRGDEDDEHADPDASEYEGDLERLELPEGADPIVSVRVDGEDVEVPLSEALAGYSRTASWTKKSQALAQDRRTFEGERSQAMQSVQSMVQQLAFAREVLQQVGVGPEQMQALDHAYRTTAAQVGEQLQAQHRTALERGRELLPEMIPEWSEPEIAKAEKASMLEYALDCGFTEAEVAQVSNPRLVKLLRDAWKGHQLQESHARSLQEVRTKTKKPKTLKPGTRISQKQKSRRSKARRMGEAKDYARRTGRTQDAAAALLHSGLLDDMD